MPPTLSPADHTLLAALLRAPTSLPDLAASLNLSPTDLARRLNEPGFAAALDQVELAQARLDRLALRHRQSAAAASLSTALAEPPNPTEARRAATALLRFKPTTPPIFSPTARPSPVPSDTRPHPTPPPPSHPHPPTPSSAPQPHSSPREALSAETRERRRQINDLSRMIEHTSGLIQNLPPSPDLLIPSHPTPASTILARSGAPPKPH